jgi:outer membrane protein OmpA-like peptidoglycan-associated protein
MSLSARRARAAVDYIVGKGMKVKRIIGAGYGETKLVNGCECEPTNESPCTDPQHQANRRTEVKVLKY